MGQHTVEKIGGTSMSEFGAVMKNIIIGSRQGAELYQRVFVVSAYGGITNLLLEHKKTGEPGVYQYFAQGDARYRQALDAVREQMLSINAGQAELGLDVTAADDFVRERLDGIGNCLHDLRRLHSYGHFPLAEQLPAVREMLAAMGEAHSAFNSAMILQQHGVNAIFLDLTGWKEEEDYDFEEKIRVAFADVDLAAELPIATGYTKCRGGIMTTYDRGYSEITFSKLAVVTGAREGVIHKEFHLSSGDPKLVGTDKVRIIGRTNFDVADQLADLGMEAIHPRASKEMEYRGIPIRVKNTFEPDHPGTVIETDYRSESPRVEMVTGRRHMVGIEVWDPDMVGQFGFDLRILQVLARHKVSYVAKNTNANTITHYVPGDLPQLEDCVADLAEAFPGARLRIEHVTIVSAIGSNMKVPGFLWHAAEALAKADINILAMDQCLRQVNMQFIVSEDDFAPAIKALHQGLVEQQPDC